MIPKIIHFCWLSNDPYPKKIQFCLDTWKKKLPDYEIMLWDFNRFPKDKSVWVSEAFDARKYAFAADYIRFYALYNYGGIYLDSDVEVIRNFDDFLHLPYMFGQESYLDNIEAAVMGAEKGFAPFKKMLDYYEGRHFVNEDGSMNTTPVPKLMTEILCKDRKLMSVESVGEFHDDDTCFCVFPKDFFSPVHLLTNKLEKTPRTVAIHHFAASWETPMYKFKKKIQRLLGHRLTLAIISAKAFVKGNK